MAHQLSTLLTPELFETLVKAKLPFSMTEPLNFEDVGQKVAACVWPVLEALSRIGMSSTPDLLQFLPPVTDDRFPRQALGLQLLLDQMSK